MPSVQQAVGVAVAAPDGLRPAGVAASGALAQRPVAARQADAAVQPWVAVQSGVRELLAAGEARPDGRRAAEVAQPDAQRGVDPSALPSAVASVFRQGPFLAGPARPRAAARFAHAMRSLQIASRSGPSWQAARNEGWSCGSNSPEGSLTKCWFDEVLE